MLFGEYLNQVNETDLIISLLQRFDANSVEQSGCTMVFYKLKCYYQDYKDADKDPIEQDIAMYAEDVEGSDVMFSHIISRSSGYYYSMYGQPWKLLPFHEVKFEDCEMTPEDVVATVIWELTWWGFREPEYDGLTFNLINDPNKFEQAILNDSSYVSLGGPYEV